MPCSVCIVGAGAAGLAAAHALARSGASVTVVEKSRGLGGRMATRWFDRRAGGGTDRWRADHGAQVVAPEPGSRADALVREVVAAEHLDVIPGRVWPFGDDGTLRPDDAHAGGPPRLSLLDGAAALGRALADATPGLDLRTQTTVHALAQSADGWTVHTTDADRQALGPFAAVVLTPPGPQAAALLEASHFDDDARTLAAGALRAATYRAQFAVMMGFEGDGVGRAAPGVQALVHAGTPGAQGLAWLAWESDKPHRAPAGYTLLVAQMSDAWTQAHYDDAQEDVAAAALLEAEALVGALPAPLFSDSQRWRYSLPDAPADRAALAPAEALGLFCAGDALVGRGRVHLALEDGLDAAARARAYLSARG